MKIGRVIGVGVVAAVAVSTFLGIALAGHSSNASSGSGKSSSGSRVTDPGGSHRSSGSAAATPCGQPASLPARYIGFITPRFPYNTTQWTQVARLTGERPNIAPYFVSFGLPFNAGLACHIERLGALPLLQINLRHTSVAAIAAGGYRNYLTHFAEAVKGMKARVAISVGHEMNGNWYPWGWHHVPAATFVKAWRVIHDTFVSAGAKNVIWVWTVNRPGSIAANPAPWWPGNAYVNWVGIDSHYLRATDTFANVYGTTISAIRKFTACPVLIAETAIRPGAHQPAQLADLFHGAFTTPGVLGFVWFNLVSRYDFRLQGRNKTLAEFRNEAQRYPA